MFVAAGLSFLLFSLYVGTVVAGFVQVIRKTLVDNIDYPLAERSSLAHDVAKSYNIIINWSLNLSVSLEQWLSVFCI